MNEQSDSSERSATEVDQSLIDQERAQPYSKRFQPDLDDFTRAARAALSDARFADGREVLRLLLASVATPSVKGRRSAEARVRSALAEIFDEPKPDGRPTRVSLEVLIALAERTMKSGPDRKLIELAEEAVEEVVGRPDERLARVTADWFNANRDEFLNAYRDGAFPHAERRIARLIVDLLTAAGLNTDPTLTNTLVTNPYLGRDLSEEELELMYEEAHEAAARRD